MPYQNQQVIGVRIHRVTSSPVCLVREIGKRQNLVEVVYLKSRELTFIVKLQPLLYRSDCAENRQSVDSTFNVWGCAILISKHTTDTGYLVLRWDDQRNHACSVTKIWWLQWQPSNWSAWLHNIRSYHTIPFCWIISGCGETGELRRNHSSRFIDERNDSNAYPLAASRLFISFFIFHISTFLSAEVGSPVIPFWDAWTFAKSLDMIAFTESPYC